MWIRAGSFVSFQLSKISHNKKPGLVSLISLIFADKFGKSQRQKWKMPLFISMFVLALINIITDYRREPTVTRLGYEKERRTQAIPGHCGSLEMLWSGVSLGLSVWEKKHSKTFRKCSGPLGNPGMWHFWIDSEFAEEKQRLPLLIFFHIRIEITEDNSIIKSDLNFNLCVPLNFG